MGKYSNNGPFYFYPWAKGPITNEMPNLWANILIMGHFIFIRGPKAQLQMKLPIYGQIF